MTGPPPSLNCELVAQGIANGLADLRLRPARHRRHRPHRHNGAPDQTGRSPASCTLFLAAFIDRRRPLAAWVPLASLAVILAIVAWNMGGVRSLSHLATYRLGANSWCFW